MTFNEKQTSEKQTCHNELASYTVIKEKIDQHNIAAWDTPNKTASDYFYIIM